MLIIYIQIESITIHNPMYVHYANMMSEENPTLRNHKPVNLTDDNDNGYHNLPQSHSSHKRTVR